MLYYYASKENSIYQLWSYHGNSQNSARRLSLASCPAPPPWQHQ
jgi:hypothetical protein